MSVETVANLAIVAKEKRRLIPEPYVHGPAEYRISAAIVELRQCHRKSGESDFRDGVHKSPRHKVRVSGSDLETASQARS
jgi:hypothetical protein